MMAVSRLGNVELKYLLQDVDVIGEVPEFQVSGLSMDSRQVTRGDLFLACAGHRTHGLDFLQQAIDNGAGLVLADVTSEWLPEKIAEVSVKSAIPVIAVSGLGDAVSKIAGRLYGHPSRSFPVIGITGTNGKTSCSQFIARAFEGRKKVGVMGTLGNGFLGALVPTTHTTMDPVSVQASLALLKSQQAEMVVMEVSSHALTQGRVTDVDFDMAVLTNFSRDHLDYHGTMTEYASAKSLLFKMPSVKSVMINADDELGQRLIKDLCKQPVRVIAYGTDIKAAKIDAWIRAEKIETLPHGLSFQVVSSWGEADVKIPLLGRFNVLNVTVALGVLLEYGVPFTEAVERLSVLKTVSGRMEMFSVPGAPTVVVDFAHTPDALQQVLESLREHVSGKLVCLFGCGGDRDKGKRPEMGRIAEKLADQVVLTDDNPRHEDAMMIIRQILKGMSKPELAVVEQNRAVAIASTIKNAVEGDVILVAGKGHESYQIVGDMKLPYSDQQEVKAALGAA